MSKHAERPGGPGGGRRGAAAKPGSHHVTPEPVLDRQDLGRDLSRSFSWCDFMYMTPALTVARDFMLERFVYEK